MTEYPICSKFEFLKQTVSETLVASKIVLDAGTGRGSAQFLAEMTPKRLVCVALPGDLRKGEQTRQHMHATGYANYELVYGDLSDFTLFEEETFDFILADYLVGELHEANIDVVFQNLFTILKAKGKILVVDREQYFGVTPSVQYVSMGEIQADPDLRNRPHRDLIDVVNIFMSMSRMLLTFIPSRRSTADYPSRWVTLWLQTVGFRHLEISYFLQSSNLKREFEQRTVWAKERIQRLKNRALQEGLLLELNKVIEEYQRREIPDDEEFFRKHYVIRTRK